MQSLHRVSAGDLQRFLDAPEELLGESRGIQIAVASFPKTPRSLLEVLVNSNSSSVAEAARLHVNWVGEITEDYRKVVSEVLRDRDLGENDRLAVELMKFAPVPPDFLSEWVPVNKLIQGLKNEYMPLLYRLQLLERLSQEGELEARLQVAESSETPVSLLELLAGDLNLAVRLAVEFNDNCPSEAVELVKSQHDLAGDWDADVERLVELGESRWGWVRLAVAQNPFAPEDVFMKLAADDEFRIRFAVARNPGVSADVLAVLMEGGDSQIKAAIAEHLNATEEILLELFSTHRDVIQKRDNLPASVLERFFREATANTLLGEHEYLYLLLKQSNTPAWILAEFANVDLEALKNQILAYYDFPISSELSEELFEDGTSFLVYVAKHPQVSAEILEMLAKYPIAKVKLAVAQNNKTYEKLKLGLLEELAVHPKENIRLELAKDINTPVHILEKIGRFEFYQTKLLREISKVLASESTVDGRSFKSSGDLVMSQLKHNILSPAGIYIDVESWMEIIETPEILQVLESKSGLNSVKKELFSIMNNLRPEWIKILPNLSNDSIREFIEQFRDVLDLINWEVKSCGRSVALAIVGNPKTPVNLRKYLTNQLFRPSLPLRYERSDCDVLLALAYNPQISEIEQIENFQKVIVENPNYATQIARDARTPFNVLEKLLERGIGKKDIAKNPATPQYILRKIADEAGTYWWEILAENTNTPIDLLFRFLKGKLDKRFHSGESIVDLVISNPSFPFLERYRLLLEKKNEEITAQVNEFMARRSDSPFALAQVVNNGDHNSKITLARNSKAPGSIIQRLVKDDDDFICRLAAENPNLPFSTALELARNSSVGVKLSLIGQIYFGNTPPTSPQILEILAEDESERVRAAVAAYSHTPVEILVRLANDSSREVKSKLIANLNTPVEVLTRLGLEENLVNQRNPNTPGIVLAHAVRNMNSKSLIDFIKHPVPGSQMLPETLAKLANNEDKEVRYLVAYHRNTPATALQQLAEDSYELTVFAVAKNLNTPPETLEVIAARTGFNDYFDIVINPNVTPRILAQIVVSSCKSGINNRVLETIARKPDTPIEALEILARREFISSKPDSKSLFSTTDDSVVQGLVYNPSLTPSILNILSQDVCVDVRKALVRHPNLTEELWLKLAEDEAVLVRETVACWEQTPVEILELLASDEEVEVRIKVAQNSNTPQNILETLAGDEDSQVLEAVASNPSISITILEQLTNDEKIEVRRAVDENPNNPENTSESLEDDIFEPLPKQTSITLSELPRIYDSNNDDLTIVLTEYAESENTFVRFVTLLHPVTPRRILAQGADSVFWLERYAVAENEATSLELLETLARDGNWIVRAAANQSLSSK